MTAKQKRRIISRRYYKKHIGKVRARARTYRNAHVRESRAKCRAYRKAHPRKVKAYNRAYYKAHVRRERARSRKAYRNDPQTHLDRQRKWRKNNPQKYRKASRTWRKKHPRKYQASYRISHHRRRAYTKDRSLSFTNQEWEKLKTKYGYRCLACDCTESQLHRLDRKLVPDHIVPIAWKGSELRGKRGLISNIQPLCHGKGGCNNSKHCTIKDYRKGKKR